MKIGLANTSPTLGAIALLLSACGSPDSASTTEAPPSESIESGGARSLEGAPVADDELANDGLANGGLADTGELAGAPLATPVGGSPTLVDKAFLRSCLVNFNSEFSLSLLTGQAWDTFVLSPFYIENCGDNSTWIYTEPRNMNHFHLGFEFESSHPFCQGSPFQVGKNIGGNCTDLKEAKKWPRYAANMQFGSGIFWSTPRTCGTSRSIIKTSTASSRSTTSGSTCTCDSLARELRNLRRSSWQSLPRSARMGGRV